MPSFARLVSSAVLLAMLAFTAYCARVYWLSVYRHSRDFNSIHDRPNINQMIVEGLRVAREHKNDMLRFIRTQPSLQGQTLVVTGATKGLGRGIAGQLAMLGADLVLPCRRCNFTQLQAQVETDARAYAKKFRSGLPLLPLGKVHVFDCDLSDMDQIDRFVADYQARGLAQAQALINNAGLNTAYMTTTKQGFETTFGVNFLGAAHLTERMLGAHALVEDGTARVISVSSEDHRMGPPIEEIMRQQGVAFGQPWGTGILDTMERYDYSKLAQTTWFLARARSAKNVAFIDICPGPVDSEITMSAPFPINHIVKFVLSLFFVPIDEAAIPVVRLAVSPEHKGVTGKHFHIAEERPAIADARDPVMQDKVLRWTAKILEMRRPLPASEL